jgi:hypothetical protein
MYLDLKYTKSSGFVGIYSPSPSSTDPMMNSSSFGNGSEYPISENELMKNGLYSSTKSFYTRKFLPILLSAFVFSDIVSSVRISFVK